MWTLKWTPCISFENPAISYEINIDLLQSMEVCSDAAQPKISMGEQYLLIFLGIREIPRKSIDIDGIDASPLVSTELIKNLPHWGHPQAQKPPEILSCQRCGRQGEHGPLIWLENDSLCSSKKCELAHVIVSDWWLQASYARENFEGNGASWGQAH